MTIEKGFPATLRVSFGVIQTDIVLNERTGNDFFSMGVTNGVNDSPSEPPLWITGLGAQYPPYLFGPEKLEEMVKKFHDPETPA